MKGTKYPLKTLRFSIKPIRINSWSSSHRNITQQIYTRFGFVVHWFVTGILTYSVTWNIRWLAHHLWDIHRNIISHAKCNLILWNTDVVLSRHMENHQGYSVKLESQTCSFSMLQMTIWNYPAQEDSSSSSSPIGAFAGQSTVRGISWNGLRWGLRTPNKWIWLVGKLREHFLNFIMVSPYNCKVQPR